MNRKHQQATGEKRHSNKDSLVSVDAVLSVKQEGHDCHAVHVAGHSLWVLHVPEHPAGPLQVLQGKSIR